MSKKAKLISVLLALLLWQAAATAIGYDILLVSPLRVLVRLSQLLGQAVFWRSILFSTLRILCGFFAATLCGAVCAGLAARFPLIETLLWPYVAVIRAVPIASFIIISLIWLNSTQLAVFISFLMVFPVLYSNLLQGLKSTDTQLAEMAALYRVPWGRKLLFIQLPQLEPYLLSACSISMGMAWKAGIAAEVIGIVSGSIGEKLYEAKVHFLTCDLLAWTVVIVVLSVLFEKSFLLLLRRLYGRLERL